MTLHEAEAGQVQEALDGWSGAHVQLWSYSTSHKHLEIRLDDPTRPGTNLHLVLEDTGIISAPTKWKAAALRVEYDGVQRVFRVSDRAANVQIVSGMVWAQPNVAPVY